MSTLQRVTPALLRRWKLPALDPALGKQSRGTLLVAGGSDTVAGAATLAGLAGLRAGAGTLKIATTRGAAPVVAGAILEACVLPLATTRKGELARRAAREITSLAASCECVVLGPGMKVESLARAARGDAVWVLDAAALVGFGALADRSVRAVLTPHAGEMASLCGVAPEEVLARPARLAREAAQRLGCVIALKGAITYIAAPDGRVFENRIGNHGLGTSGSGDVLAGVIGGLAARGADPLQAAVWGVYLHARAGDLLARRIGPLGYLARELLDQIPRVLAALGAQRA